MSSFTGNSGNSAPKKQKLAPVQVFLRIRPKHDGDGVPAISYCTPKEIHIKGHLKGYSFDQIFDEKTSQVKVYKTVVGKMITDVTKGYNCTIFAYGQTGTGKTYTVIGDDCVKDVDDTFNWQQESNAGIILRSALHLYEELDKMDPNIQRTVTVSFMEIYNEEIRDLLCDKELTPLRIYEDKLKSVHIKNLQEVTVLNPWDIISLLKKGCERRQVASTLMNHRSSRSHTVFTITVSTMQTISITENISNITCGKLNLIDLAGSENIAKSGSKEQRAREATNINQSLLTLGRVIKALVENSSHVPYRESKLTRILQDSLGGKAKTSIIATISPGMASLDETMNTLDYAHNARNITNCPTINLRTSATAAAVQEELLRLKRDLFATANEQGVYMDKENYEEMTQSLTQFKKEIASKHETIRALTEQVEDLEAQRHEWENLRESFKKTSQAYQVIKSEIQKKEEEMLRDSELLEYYKSESTKLQEFADFMLTRENHLHKKLDYVYSSSSKNQTVIEQIIEIVKETIDSLVLPENSDNFHNNVSALIQFNDKVCQMLSNVANQLEDKSRNVKNAEEVEENTSDDYSRTILGDVYESMEYLRNKFHTFTETCCTKITELHACIDRNNVYLSKIEETRKEELEIKGQIQTLINKDNKNYEDLKKGCNEIVSKEKNLILEYFEERQKSIELEQLRIQKMKEILKNDDLEKRLAEYGENRKKIFENISNLHRLEKSAYQKIDSITENALQSVESSYSNVEEMRNCVLYIRTEVSKVLEHVLTDYRKQNSEMANVIGQISHILDIEGKAHIEMVNQSLTTTGEKLNECVKKVFETSVLPITHAGDTPKPLEGQRIPRSMRNSITKNLFPRTISEDAAGSQ
ncbi:kinesin-like protein Klp61F [Coccinella septempunctata]|uniref:kinesin-like protein Klp61F n=1 Tax=Coccinella septempunctata TaxID=41139 RepID=UPI001D098A93|nr:kinesin-like protein Klp61F [Coccinella septempunctata]